MKRPYSFSGHDKSNEKLKTENCTKTIQKEKIKGAVTTPLVGELFAPFFLKLRAEANEKRSLLQRLEEDFSSDSDSDKYESNFSNLRISETGDDLHLQFEQKNSEKITWIGSSIHTKPNSSYFNEVSIGKMVIKAGDFVAIQTKAEDREIIAHIAYMWKDTKKNDLGFFHGEVLLQGNRTILGDVGSPKELFMANQCCDMIPLSHIIRKPLVKIINNASTLGKNQMTGCDYYYGKNYDKCTARFEDLPSEETEYPNNVQKMVFCPGCDRKARKTLGKIPILIDELSPYSKTETSNQKSEWRAVLWENHEYKSGDGVFLKANVFQFGDPNMAGDITTNNEAKMKNNDSEIYTEYYRKNKSELQGSNNNTVQPYCVGLISSIIGYGLSPIIAPQDIFLKVNIMYRPENTSKQCWRQADMNMVYWTKEEKVVPFSAVRGFCDLVYENNIPYGMSKRSWSEAELNRFYFYQSYCPVARKFDSVPQKAMEIGKLQFTADQVKPISNGYPSGDNVKPLKTMDIFAGCGGLAEGLRSAGVADCQWAIESSKSEAQTFQINHPKCKVYNEDCNSLLADALMGKKRKSGLPPKGAVELLCGAPPCQGFSGLNTFNTSEDSIMKNSLIATYLSYCDYYRPRYFILENVRNFVAYKKGEVLKLTIRALLDMGYQCTFGILQAGNYGVPQTRRRLIIMASAPGNRLPSFPKPTHASSRTANRPTVVVDGKKYASDAYWDSSAPRRSCTIADAISDLPDISSGASDLEISYVGKAKTDIQRSLRGDEESSKLRDHICKDVTQLDQERFHRIPARPKSDWRDLPNITLAHDTKCEALKYCCHVSSGSPRGMCACAEERACEPRARQGNTLSPWWLPRTAQRHNNWTGDYGRLSWDGYCGTMPPDAAPSGSQGRVLHPRQPRVLSVRECARTQGFPDTYYLEGTVQDKYRQIENAVPPPLAQAIGREIMKALHIPADQSLSALLDM